MSAVYIRFAVHEPDSLRRSSRLERLLVRAPRPVPVPDWRADAFALLMPQGAQLPSIAAVAWHAARRSATLLAPAAEPASISAPMASEPMWVCIATPVHLTAGMTSVAMLPGGILELRPVEAEALATDFNRVFGGEGVRLAAGRAGVLLCAFDEVLQVQTHDPESAMGQDVFEFQPSGADAARLRRLMSEIEMWLFEHEVNRSRLSQAKRPVTGLWLWGGGPTSVIPPVPRGWIAGIDPLFSAFGGEERWPSEPGGGVIVCGAQPGSAEWADVEARWLVPAIGKLESRRLSRLDLSAGRCRLSIEAGVHLRFWRRPRPWWESFGMSGKATCAGAMPGRVDRESDELR